LPSGTPAVDTANSNQRYCALATSANQLASNNANQYDGPAATSCYYWPLVGTPTLQCGLSVGLGTPPSPGSNCYQRMNTALPSMIFIQSIGTSLYNALDVNLTKRVTHGLQFNATYTWSKLMDNHQGDTAQDGQIIAEEPLHRNSMWAPASFDLNQNFHLSAIYHFPNFSERKGFAGAMANGWMTNGILSLQTGYPFSAYLSSDRENIGYEPSYTNVADTPDVVAGRSKYSITHGTSPGCGTGASAIAAGAQLGTAKHWFDPCAFAIQPAGFIGTEPRDFLRGPGLTNVDFSIVKDTPVSKLGEAGKIEFRAEIFDLFNHPNFALPSGVQIAGGGACPAIMGNANAGVEGCSITPLSGAGAISATITNPGALPAGQRQIQFGLKLMF
jgi:hypothetical protein